MIKQFTLGLICLLLLGCGAFRSNFNFIELGMTKEEVVKVLGRPKERKAKQDLEILEYHDFWAHNPFRPSSSKYWVFFKNDELIQWGKIGDFGTKKQKQQYKIDGDND